MHRSLPTLTLLRISIVTKKARTMQALSTSTLLFLMLVKFKINLNSDMFLVLQSRLKNSCHKQNHLVSDWAVVSKRSVVNPALGMSTCHQKCLFLWGAGPPFNTRFYGLVRVHIPNCISMPHPFWLGSRPRLLVPALHKMGNPGFSIQCMFWALSSLRPKSVKPFMYNSRAQHTRRHTDRATLVTIGRILMQCMRCRLIMLHVVL